MTENAITLTSNQFIAPVADVRTALQAYQNMKDFVSGVLRENVDFGVVPGTDKPTLLKPGAEKLSRFFGMLIHLEVLAMVEDWTGADHNGEAFFFYRYKAKAARGDMVIAEGIGSCSSWEKKYRYRNGERKCPVCGKTTIIKGKEEYGGGWICFAKKGGCGAKFQSNDPAITEQQVGQVINPDPADIVNTIDKMAQKRAIIAAVLLACNASEYFTQDVEDYIDGTFTQEPPKAQPVKSQEQPRQAQRKPAQQAPEQQPLDGEPETDSSGVPYHDLETPTLSGMFNAMQNKIKAGEYSPEELPEKQRKCEEIAKIMAARRAATAE